MNMPEKFWKSIMGAVGILTIFLIVLSVKEIKSLSYVGANPNNLNTITVDGKGEAVAVPDVASFSFTVTETAKTVADAQAKMADKVNSALKVVRDAGVADKDIQTVSYNISPHYEYQSFACTATYCPPSKSVQSGYDVSEGVQVKIRDLSKAGSIFSSIGSVGVQNLNGLDFSVDNPDAVNAIARGKAIANAKAKADDLVKQLGVRIVRISSFSESGNSPRPMVYGMGAAKDMMSTSATAEIVPGENKVTSNVYITYEIR